MRGKVADRMCAYLPPHRANSSPALPSARAHAEGRSWAQSITCVLGSEVERSKYSWDLCENQ